MRRRAVACWCAHSGKAPYVEGAPHSLAETDLVLDQLDPQLRGQAFLLGPDFTLADASVFFPLWLFKNSPDLFEHMAARPAVAAWFARIEGFGSGAANPMSTSEALAIARAANPATAASGLQQLGDLELAAEVGVVADDYGVEGFRGKVAFLSAERISLLRRDPDLGEIAVHFPHAGYRITKL